MEDTVLSCDWGTSSLRLRWVETHTGRLRGEVRSGEGIGATHAAWKTAGGDRLPFYQRVLTEHVARLAAEVGRSLAGVPVVLSGMASSSIGMVELPYAALPFPIDGSAAGARYLEPTEEFPHPLLLISGVRSEWDVMRGEETQVIGLYARWADQFAEADDVLLILPGTHSKHVTVRDGVMTDFRTYLTGELFALLTRHGILRDSLQPAGAGNSLDWAAFRLGVRAGAAGHVLNALFSVRTNQLFGRLDPVQNHDYLSGLLIGSELHELVGTSQRLLLGSGNHVFAHYEHAAQELALPVTCIPAELMEESAVAGQLAVYERAGRLSVFQSIYE